MKTAIITGPTGIIGVALIDYLISLKIEVYAIVRPRSNHIERLAKSNLIHIIESDLASLNAINIKSLSDAVMFHLGWEGAEKEKRNNIELQIKNIQYTINSVYLAKRTGCKTFVFAGSQAEYGQVDGEINVSTPTKPIVAYGMAKLCSQGMSRLLCNELNIKYCGLRIFSIFGKYDSENTLISYLLRTLKQYQIPELTSCSNNWNYLYVKDAVRAIFLVAEKGKHKSIYNIASNDNRKLRFYVEDIRDILDIKTEIVFGVINQSSDSVINLNVNNEPLFQDTGFMPEYSFKEGIKDWMKNGC